jgi:hypothetical protein
VLLKIYRDVMMVLDHWDAYVMVVDLSHSTMIVICVVLNMVKKVVFEGSFR